MVITASITAVAMQSGEVCMFLVIGGTLAEMTGVVRKIFAVKSTNQNIAQAIEDVRVGADHQMECELAAI